MARAYTVTFEQLSVSAPIDFVQISPASNKTVRILRAWAGVTNTTLVTSQSIAIRCRFLPATVSNGSGGTSGTVCRVDIGDSVGGATTFLGSTSKATTNSTAVVLSEYGGHILSNYDEAFLRVPIIQNGEAFVLEFLSTPTGSAPTFSGGVLFEEVGG